MYGMNDPPKPLRKCSECNCRRECTFGKEYGYPTKCKKHIPIISVDSGREEEEAYIEEVDGITCVKYKKLTIMEDIIDPSYFDCKNKRCEKEGCITRSSYDFPIITGKTMRGVFCSVHKKDGMIDVTHQKCCGYNKETKKKCQRQPHFGFVGNTAKHCSEHKLDGMSDIKHYFCKKCKEKSPLNPSRANWNYVGCTGAIACKVHKTDTMFEIYPYKPEYDDNKKRKRLEERINRANQKQKTTPSGGTTQSN